MSASRRRKGGVSWATLTAYFKAFAASEIESAHREGREPAWAWEEVQPCPGGMWHSSEGCCCKTRMRLLPAAAAAAKARMAIEAKDAAKREAAAAAAEARAAAAAANDDGVAPPLVAPEDALRTGSHLLVVTGQCRQGRLRAACALELNLAARHFAVSGTCACVCWRLGIGGDSAAFFRVAAARG